MISHHLLELVLIVELVMYVYIYAANVFGKPKTNTDYLTVSGDGFKLSVPAKWNPSKEVEYPGQVLRYEDNFDSNSNVGVMITPTDKKSIKEYGTPEEFLAKVIQNSPCILRSTFFVCMGLLYPHMHSVYVPNKCPPRNLLMYI